MRLKAIPAWEQYIEKILLGLLLLALMAVLILQFASNPNVVEVRVDRRNESLAPGQLNSMLIEWSDNVLNDQKPDAPPMDEPPSKDEVRMIANQVDRITSGRVVPSGMLPRTSPILASGIMPTEIQNDLPYNDPAPLTALVMMNRVESFSDELTEAAIEEYPELTSFTGAEGNREIDWLIPVGEIDMKAIRGEFDGSDAEHAQIPPYWRDNTYAIVDIVFMRETMQPDGTWADEVEVPSVIGQLSFREDLATYEMQKATYKRQSVLRGEQANNQRLALREKLVGELYKPALQTEIVQPVFFETEWASADRFLLDPAGTSMGGQSASAIDLETKYLRLRTKIERARSELDELGGPLESDDSRKADGGDDEDDGGRGGRGGRGGGGAPPGGGTLGGGSKTAGGDDRANAGDAKAERAKKLRINKTRQLRMLEKQLQALFARLQQEVPQSDLLGGGGTMMDASLVNLEADDVVLTWTHDLAVTPGETYHYRCVAKFYNPFFTRGFQLNEEQEKSLSYESTLVTRESNWSDPVTVDSGTRFFVTSARPASGKGLGEATIEVFSKGDGRYWSETYTVKPGDRIGGSKRRSGTDPLDFNTDWYVVDIISISSNDESGTPGAEVVVQRLGTGDDLDYRNPFADAADPELGRLDSLVRNADERSRSVLETEGDTSRGGGRGDREGGGGRDGGH